MNNELHAIVEYMEKERGIDREVVLQAVESALVNAARKVLGNEQGELRIDIDRKTFDIHAMAMMTIVEGPQCEEGEITLDKAREVFPECELELGQQVEMEVTPKDFGRIAAQTAKQSILHKIRQAEKNMIYDEYKDRAGDVVSGVVRRFERNDVIIELGRAEGVMTSRERVPTEDYQQGDRVRAYVLSIQNKGQGPEILLSRSHPDFVRRLFELEVSEIADGTVEVKGIAREPGYRTKLAVLSHDDKVDPVGACVGMRGMRVKNIVRELSGEKIDIVRWNEDIRIFVANALAPAKLSKITVEEETRSVYVIVDPEQLSLTIGKRGQNARLTNKLTGWRIDIQKDEGDISFEEKVAQAISKLAGIEGIGQENAVKLVQSGFLTLEGIMAAELDDMVEAVDGFDAAAARRVLESAQKAYEKVHISIDI